MKKLLIAIVSVAILAAALLMFISDRDRGLWLLNTAINLTNPHPVISDVQYGDQAWQKLDVSPAQTVKNAPVMVFVYGGSWRHGRKDQYRFAADAFIRLGYTVVVPDYLKYPDKNAKFPSFAIDVAKALAWVKKNINQHNGDNRNIFVAGHSAGAHTVAMLTTDGQYLREAGLTEKDIRGVAGIAGPYSFTPDRPHTKAVFGPEERYTSMDVFNYVDGSEPATLLLHSKGDTQVGQYNSDGFYQRLQQHQVPSKKIIYSTPSHIDMVTHLHPWFAKDDEPAKDIDRFFRTLIK